MERITRAKAIRLKCLDCCCGSAHEVRACVCRDCTLWRYRFGYEVDGEGNRIGKSTLLKNDSMLCKNDPTDDMEG